MKYFLYILLICTSLFLVSCGKDETAVPTEVSSQTGQVALGFEGVGTEPFWAFRFTGGALNWQEPGETDTLQYTASGSASIDDKTQEISISAGDFIATLIPDESCSDGMTENVYAYKVLLQKDTRTFSGCAREYVGEL